MLKTFKWLVVIKPWSFNCMFKPQARVDLTSLARDDIQVSGSAGLCRYVTSRRSFLCACVFSLALTHQRKMTVCFKVLRLAAFWLWRLSARNWQVQLIFSLLSATAAIPQRKNFQRSKRGKLPREILKFWGEFGWLIFSSDSSWRRRFGAVEKPIIIGLRECGLERQAVQALRFPAQKDDLWENHWREMFYLNMTSGSLRRSGSTFIYFIPCLSWRW